MKAADAVVNVSVGTVGTFVASLAASDAAAVFAGVATGVWMLTQAALAIRREFKK